MATETNNNNIVEQGMLEGRLKMGVIEEVVVAFIKADEGIVMDDHGDGSGGPRYLHADDMQRLLDEGWFSDFQDADLDGERVMSVTETIRAVFPNEPVDESDYKQVHSYKGEGSNPYGVTLLLYIP